MASSQLFTPLNRSALTSSEEHRYSVLEIVLAKRKLRAPEWVCHTVWHTPNTAAKLDITDLHGQGEITLPWRLRERLSGETSRGLWRGLRQLDIVCHTVWHTPKYSVEIRHY